MNSDFFDNLSLDEIEAVANFLVSEWNFIKGKLRLDNVPTHAVNNSDIAYNKSLHDQSWSVNDIGDTYVYSTGDD